MFKLLIFLLVGLVEFNSMCRPFFEKITQEKSRLTLCNLLNDEPPYGERD